MKQDTKTLWAWALYDWGSSAYAALIETFLFAAYFTTQVIQDPIHGQALWGVISGIAAFLIALFGPILGAIGDQTGKQRSWLVFFTGLAIAATLPLFSVYPEQSYQLRGMGLVIIATVATEIAFIFYNGLLPTLSPTSQIGRWSGWGWGLGYLGGLFSLIIAQLLYTSFGNQAALGIRTTFLLAGFWYLLFSLPLFFSLPILPAKEKGLLSATKKGMRQLFKLLRELPKRPNLTWFLVARMFYNDALLTLFAFGGLFSVSVFSLSFKELISLGIALHLSAGLGALLLARLDDYIGSRRLICLTLISLFFLSVGVLFSPSRQTFFSLGLSIGFFVGPLQASSRAFLARITPQGMQNKLFGLFAFSGKATAFFAPWLISWLTLLTQNQRAGLSVIPILFFISFLLMLKVRDNETGEPLLPERH